MLSPRVDVRIMTTLSAYADARPLLQSLVLVRLQTAKEMILRVSLFIRRTYNVTFRVLNPSPALLTLVESLCAPVGGTFPSIPGACRASAGNGTGCGIGTGSGSPKPSATAHLSGRGNRLDSFKDSVANKW